MKLKEKEEKENKEREEGKNNNKKYPRKKDMEKIKEAKAKKESDFINDSLSGIEPLDEESDNEEYYNEEEDENPERTKKCLFSICKDDAFEYLCNVRD